MNKQEILKMEKVIIEHAALNQIEEDIHYGDYEAYSEMMNCLMNNPDNMIILWNYLSENIQENVNKGLTRIRYE